MDYGTIQPCPSPTASATARLAPDPTMADVDKQDDMEAASVEGTRRVHVTDEMNRRIRRAVCDLQR